MNTRAAILTPVQLQLDELHTDRIRASVDVTLDGSSGFRVTATLTHTGRVLDLQSHGDPWQPGTTGDQDLDRQVLDAIAAAFIAARNAAVVIELGRRIRYRGRRAR